MRRRRPPKRPHYPFNPPPISSIKYPQTTTLVPDSLTLPKNPSYEKEHPPPLPLVLHTPHPFLLRPRSTHYPGIRFLLRDTPRVHLHLCPHRQTLRRQRRHLCPAQFRILVLARVYYWIGDIEWRGVFVEEE